MGRRQTRGMKAVKAIRAAVPEGVELDEVDEDVLQAVRRAYDRAEDLDADLARERAATGPSANRLTLLAAEVRLQEAQGEKWGRQVIDRAEAVVKVETKDWRAQKAARARWDGRYSQGGR
ncbi:hypothetical protein [Dietzia cinnamea]|uniref:hypothetical protein n=1 Tax=Dietzia cinnamea TaxID=321318 RepID=UPI0021A9523C|nr:hypothetical protein [Dietzia cinnamea]MCT1639741.1 hypothetical protein [Dietzia cinnamea]